MGRKNLLSDLMDDITPATAATAGSNVEPAKTTQQPTLGSRGAVGAMSRSLEKLSAENDLAKSLTEQVSSGQLVVEVAPSAIDVSIVPDRMPGTDTDHAALVKSIAESGQLVPVLLRPHPQQPSRFQTAYGHRRIRALTELGKSVRAVIRHMTDEELVVAQGKENGERRDLTFIERATYATALEDRGFKRDTIGASLSVDKTELSRLISVARAIPRHLIDAIGPAPKTGRRRWMDLEAAIEGKSVETVITPVLSSDRFAKSDSDSRFAIVIAALSPVRSADKPDEWVVDGRKIATINRKTNRVTLAVDEKEAPAFGDFLIDRLPALYAEYVGGRSKAE